MWKIAFLAKFAQLSRHLAGETENRNERTQDSRRLSQHLKAERLEGCYPRDYKFGYCQLLVA
jgi:hypothetical protein